MLKNWFSEMEKQLSEKNAVIDFSEIRNYY